MKPAQIPCSSGTFSIQKPASCSLTSTHLCVCLCRGGSSPGVPSQCPHQHWSKKMWNYSI